MGRASLLLLLILFRGSLNARNKNLFEEQNVSFCSSEVAWIFSTFFGRGRTAFRLWSKNQVFRGAMDAFRNSFGRKRRRQKVDDDDSIACCERKGANGILTFFPEFRSTKYTAIITFHFSTDLKLKRKCTTSHKFGKKFDDLNLNQFALSFTRCSDSVSREPVTNFFPFEKPSFLEFQRNSRRSPQSHVGKHLFGEMPSPYFVANFFPEHYPPFCRIFSFPVFVESYTELPEMAKKNYSVISRIYIINCSFQRFFSHREQMLKTVQITVAMFNFMIIDHKCFN